MAVTGRVLYDFAGDESQGELSLIAGEEVIVRRQDVGEGWWEGSVRGKTGLFPESYVELGDGQDFEGADDGEWDEEEEGGWDEGHEDDDYDDGGDGGDYHQGAPAVPPAQRTASSQPVRRSGTFSSGDSFGRTETLKRSVNRFSVFVKAGAEGFMLGAVKDVTIDPNSVIHIQEGAHGPEWAPNPQPYGDLQVNKAGTRQKFKGIKSYEAYNIVGGGAGSVERRHKHFQWLHERLAAKYSCICVPPLPDKQYMSRYGENFVDKRQQKLQAWMNRVIRHPLLSQDELSLRHFLSCATSDNKGWKLGKRKAEKDPLTGPTFFKLISAEVACPRDATNTIDQFGHFARDMDKAVKKCTETAVTHASRMSGAIKQEYKKVASSFSQLGDVFAKPADGDSVKLSMSIVSMANTYEAIAEMWNEQPLHDQLPWLDGLKEYSSLISQFGDAVQSSKSAQSKADEISNVDEASSGEKDAVQSRADIIHLLTLCEIRHFQRQRMSDFKQYSKAYLQAQVRFHQQIVAKLQQAESEFDKLVDF